ncbi:MAG: tetratricopeptide (TPR) repeat protein, partial [Rhodothermales bacterium]
DREPWHRDALVLSADLDYRAGLFDEGLERIERVRQLNAYDPQANFVAGNLYRAAGSVVDAKEAFGWAARSMAFRSAAYTQLADIALLESDWQEAEHYASLALDYDRINLQALHARAIAARHLDQAESWTAHVKQMLSIDPLNHAARAESFLRVNSGSDGGAGSAREADRFMKSMRSEFPDQTLLEVAIGYANRGFTEDAARLLRTADTLGAVARAWLWHLEGATGPLPALQASEVEFAFPYRTETLGVLDSAAEVSDHWSWTYLQALNHWALGRVDQAIAAMTSLGNRPDLSSFYVSRAHLGGGEADLLRAQTVFGAGRLSRVHLIRHYQTEGQWERALASSDEGRLEYPRDFNLALLHSRSLLYLNRPAEAAAILDRTHVLPSENAAESHLMFEWAHVMMGMDLLDSRPAEAAGHFRRSMEWPEHLGQGRPYDPDERLPLYLLGVAAKRTGDNAAARSAFQKVVEASAGSTAQSARLAVASLRALGRDNEADAWAAEIPPRLAAPGLTTLDETLFFRALTFDNR